MIRRDLWTSAVVAALSFVFVGPSTLFADDPASELLRLIPPDAGVALRVNHLRDHASVISKSSLTLAIERLPVIADWRKSNAGMKFARASTDIERVLGLSMQAVRDDLLGDAVSLSLHLAPDAPLDRARGLFLVKARDLKALRRLVALKDQAEIADGSIAEVVEVGTGSRGYRLRRAKLGSHREDEFYRIFDDGTFAWSNSEALILCVIDRKAGQGKGLADEPAFRDVQKGLPANSLATLYVEPRFADRVLRLVPKSDDPGDARASEFLGRHLRSIAGLGAAIEWRNGPILHLHEVLDPKVLDIRIVRWALSKSSPDALTRRIPSTALASFAAPVDVESTYDALVELVPDSDRDRMETIVDAVRGILLGLDLRQAVLPRLGPALIAYIEPPTSGSSSTFPVVGAVELREDGNGPKIADALDNALRTLLCLYALDPKNGAVGLRVESRKVGNLRVTTLGGPSSPFAYAVGPDCLVVGTSPDAVGRFNGSEPDPRPAAFKAAYFPTARFYAFADLPRLAQAARTHRAAFAKGLASPRAGNPESALMDLDRAAASLDLFDGAFLAVSIDPELKSVHQTIGLIGK